MVNPLLPIRHPTRDFFVCDVFDTLPSFKDDQASMEHPVFSLSTKPDMRELHYEHNGNELTIIPSGKGLATIHDKDILLYCTSYLRAALNDGHEPNQTLRFKAYDLLVSTNRQTHGQAYKRLSAAFDRLKGTTIKTNIRTGEFKSQKWFGLIDSAEIVTEAPNGQMVAVEIKLSDWLYNAVMGNELLTINRDYFRLRRPFDRRLYEIARKHCGKQRQWSIGLEKLQKKIGTTTPLKKFRLNIRRTVETDHLPDYRVEIADDVVTFTNRKANPPRPKGHQNTLPPLPLDTYEKAKKVAPGFDIYALESEWQDWSKDKEPVKNPAGAFIGFCKSFFLRRQ